MSREVPADMKTTRRIFSAFAVSSMLCAAASPARADLSLDLVSSSPAPRIDFAEQKDKAIAKRRSGTSLTIMALVHLSVGGAVLVADAITSHQCASSSHCMNEGGSIPSIVVGSLLVSSGAIFASAGVPMWIVGARDAKRAEVGITASAGGLRLTF